MVQLQRILGAGLFATTQHWDRLRTAQDWVLRGAHILANAARADGATVEAEYWQLLTDVLAHQSDADLEPFATHFYKVTRSYWRGLFYCYDVPDLPRTNNALEQYFGSARHQERRATGRKSPTRGVVVRGSVRVVAAVATRLAVFDAADLQPRDRARWQQVRQDLEVRHERRRAYRCFRRDPAAYLAQLEERLLQQGLPF